MFQTAKPTKIFQEVVAQVEEAILTGRIQTGQTLPGSGGLGYDPIFEPASEPPGGRTLGLWSPEEKNVISHRALAARRMAPVLARLGF